MKRLTIAAALILFASSTAFAAQQTWTGKISDSMCGASHTAAEHGKKMTDRACTQACVKAGAKYVFVADGKVYNIANQNAKGLAARAGQTVSLTGEMSGDTITVSKIGGAKKSKG